MIDPDAPGAWFDEQVAALKAAPPEAERVVCEHGNLSDCSDCAEYDEWKKSRIETPAYHVVLKAMREAMESHPFWRKVKHTPAENDLPVRAANVAMQFIGEL